ncbi:MAG: DUF2085 domain-containing protein [Candidatus Altiarchaeota archaeon]
MTDEDPFLAAIGFLEGRDNRLNEWGAKLDRAFEVLQSNIYMTAYLFICLLLLLLLASPAMLASGNQSLTNVGAFMHVAAGILMMCHQLPDRSLVFGGIPMPVCARDAGIYVGAAAGFATVLLKNRPKFLSSIKMVALATAPIALDGITQTVLLMRESNNVLRLATGLIFGLGIAAYAANRILLWRRPKFREQVRENGLMAADMAAAAFMLVLFLQTLGGIFGADYLTEPQAVEHALKEYGPLPHGQVRTYYVSSFTPVTIQMDPFYGSHRDIILDDIMATDFAKKRLTNLLSPEVPEHMNGDISVGEALKASADKEHKYGIWAVAFLSGDPVRGRAPYLSEGQGTYIYIDPITAKTITKTTH